MTLNISPYYKSNSIIVQQCSMRSYKTGLYDLTADGNVNLTLHRLGMTKIKDFIWVLPKNSTKYSKLYLKSILFSLGYLPSDFKLVFIEYGKNAYDNRTVVPKSFKEYYDANLLKDKLYLKQIISDFCCIDADVYTFNISKVKGLDRWFIDEFIKDQQEAASKAPVIVLNENQKELLNGTNVIVQNYIMSEKVLKIIFKNSLDVTVIQRLVDELPNSFEFFPFRITDPAYKFDEVLNKCKKQNKPLVVTDVNDSCNTEDVINLSDFNFGAFKKHIYFSLLWLASKEILDVTCTCHENIFEVMHQTPIELAYFLGDKFTMYGEHGIISNTEIKKLILEDIDE